MSAVSDATLKIAIGRLVSPDRIRFQLEAEFGCSLADKVDLIRECLPPPPPPSFLPPSLHALAYGLHGSASGSSSHQHAQPEPHPAPPVRSSSSTAAAAASALLSVSTLSPQADSARASAGPRFVPSTAAPHFIHHPRQSAAVLEAPFTLPVMPLPTSAAAFGEIGQSPHRPFVCSVIPEAASHARAPQHYQQPTIQYTVSQEELHARRGYTVDRDRSAFVCEICQHGCVSGNDLNRHRAEVHLNKHRFACDQCAYRCARNSALRDHKIARHANHSMAHEDFSRSDF